MKLSKLSADRIATLKRNGGMDAFTNRPKPGKRLDRKWCVSRSGDCFIAYRPNRDRWVMWGKGFSHSIEGDSSLERINAHWAGFRKNVE